jgi:hypothetical protein
LAGVRFWAPVLSDPSLGLTAESVLRAGLLALAFWVEALDVRSFLGSCFLVSGFGEFSMVRDGVLVDGDR